MSIKISEGKIIGEFVFEDDITKFTNEQFAELIAGLLIKLCGDDYIRSRDTLEKVFDDVMASQRENVS